MSTEAEPGTSYDWIEGPDGLWARQLDTERPLDAATALTAYHRGGDGVYSTDDFLEARAAHILLADEDGVAGCLGIEFCSGDQGHWSSWLYLQGVRPGLIKRHGQAIVDLAFTVARDWGRHNDVPPRMMLKGKPGWATVLRKFGIHRDADGWITADQERFKHYGHEQRFQ